MSSLEWLFDLCAVAKASGKSIITDNTPLKNQLPPSKDPCYSAPEGWESRQPGDVLRIRSTSNLIDIVEGSGASPSGKAAILSYQFDYNTYNVDSSPSCALSGVMAKSEPNLGIKSSSSLIAEMLSFGWIVNNPDHLGPTAAFGASVLAGHATLDALRAVHSLISMGGNLGFNTAIWGYSGGSIATFSAAELQPSYAPELNISAAVVGGLVDNISAALDKINKSTIAGTLIALLLGITAQYPEERAYLESRLVLETKDEFTAAMNIEVTQNAGKYSRQHIYAFFIDGGADLRALILQNLYDKQAELNTETRP
ncbi:lipase [Fusarium denticulatum]|uniref:Lipase n=1 Tax=Fusarium denticulatum TaxID=48507 RepID=A0A8H5WZW2_9HYPO|nr:lipase [Fusarium denticulatum]